MAFARVACGLLVGALAPAQDFVELPWRVDEQGRLEIRSVGDGANGVAVAYGPWEPVFADLLEVDADGVPGLARRFEWRPFEAIPVLVHGPGGVGAIDDAVRRLRRLGLGLTVEYSTLRQLDADPLVDLLRVRHLASVDLVVAKYALYRYCADEKRDPFVRAAATAAVLAADDERYEHLHDHVDERVVKRNGTAALQAGLARLPDDVDLVVGVHGAAIGSTAALMAGWRDAQLEMASARSLAAGGNLSPALRNAGQFAADIPGQLPYELAVRFGNFRVDYSLLAARCDGGPSWWLHLGGAFQPEAFARGVRAAGGTASDDGDGTVRGTLCGYELRVSPTALEAWPADFAIASRGARLAELHGRAGPDQPPVFLHAPADGRAVEALGFAGSTIDVRLQLAPRRLSATVRCADAAAAERALAAFGAWQGARTCEPGDKVPAKLAEHPRADYTWGDVAQSFSKSPDYYALVYRRVVQAVTARLDGATLELDVDLTPYPLSDLAPILGANTVRLLRDG